MVTKVSGYVTQRASRDLVSPKLVSGHGRDWRALFRKEEAEAIWQRILILTQVAASDRESDFDQLTQDVFLHLLVTERFNPYIEQEYSDEEISQDLLSLLREY